MTELERMLSGDVYDMAWRLRAAMALSDITVRELAETAGVTTTTVNCARSPQIHRKVGYTTYRKIFLTIKDCRPGALRMVVAAEKARA